MGKHFERIRKGYEVRHQKQGATTMRDADCKLVNVSRSPSDASVHSNNGFGRTNGNNPFSKTQEIKRRPK